MAKVKPARAKTKSATKGRGIGCIVLLVLGMLLAILFLIYIMGQHANQT
jgi:uncharacterized integral membrane protein